MLDKMPEKVIKLTMNYNGKDIISNILTVQANFDEVSLKEAIDQAWDNNIEYQLEVTERVP